MADESQQSIKDLLGSINAEKLDPAVLLAVIIQNDPQLAQTARLSMERAITSSMKSLSQTFEIMNANTIRAGGTLNIGDLLGQKEEDRRNTKKKYNQLISTALSSLTRTFKTSTAQLDNIEIDFSSLFSIKDNDNKRIRKLYNNVISKALDTLKASIPTSFKIADSISLTDMIKPSPTDASGAADSIQHKTSSSSAIQKIFKPLSPAKLSSQNTVDQADKSYFTTKPEIIVSKFGSEARRQLAKIVSDVATPVAKNKDTKENTPKLGAWAIAGGLILGGLFALYKGITGDPKWKGTLKIVGTSILGAGTAMIKKSLSPLIGMAKSLFDPILKSVTTIFGVAKTQISKIGSNLGGGKIFAMLSKILKPFKAGLKMLKVIPGIGTLISLYFAYDRFKKGDIPGGLIDLAAGLAYAFPGIGTAIGIGLDIYNATRDYKGEDKPTGSPASVGDVFGFITGKAKEWISKKNIDWANIPVLGAFFRMNDAWTAIKSGNVLEGLEIIGDAFMEANAEAGNAIITGIRMFKSMLERPSEERPAFINTSINILDTAKQKLKTAGHSITRKLFDILPGSLQTMFKVNDDGTIDFIGPGAFIDNIKRTAEAALEKMRYNITTTATRVQLPQVLNDILNVPTPSNTTSISTAGNYLALSKPPHADFILRPGKDPESFSSKDTLIGAKPGGAFASAFNDLNKNIMALAVKMTESRDNTSAGASTSIVQNINSSSDAPLPESRPEFREPSDIIVQRASFWRTNYGYIIPA